VSVARHVEVLRGNMVKVEIGCGCKMNVYEEKKNMGKDVMGSIRGLKKKY
jgi:hypothetical protein